MKELISILSLHSIFSNVRKYLYKLYATQSLTNIAKSKISVDSFIAVYPGFQSSYETRSVHLRGSVNSFSKDPSH